MHTIIKILIKCVICLNLFQSTTQLTIAENVINRVVFNDCRNNDVWNKCELFIDSKRNVSQIIVTTKLEPYGRWDTAMWVCNKYNSSLVSIESEEKWKFIQTFFNLNMYWTSGRKNTALGKWIWNSTGVEFTFTYWGKHATPSDSVNQCMLMWSRRYKWENISCNIHHRIMCEFDININRIISNTSREVINTETNINNNALKDCLTSGVWYDCALFIDHNTNNSKIIAKPIAYQFGVTWREAVYICYKFNSSLLSIDSEEKWKFLQSFISDGMSYSQWTSGRKNKTSEKWKWNSNGNEFTFSDFRQREKEVSFYLYKTQILCLSIAKDVWANDYCTLRHTVICEFDVNSDQKTANTNIKLINTNTDYENNTPDACLQNDLWIDCKLFVDNEKNISQIIAKPKYEAERHGHNNTMNICAKYNASSISIESQEKQDFIESFFNDETMYWTSGRQNTLFNWIWNTTGNEFSYSNWPYNDYIITNNVYTQCLGVVGPYWYIKSCWDRYNVLCEFNI